MTRLKTALLCFVVGLVMGLLLYDGCNTPRLERIIERDTLRERTIDTVVEQRWRERIVVKQGPARIEYLPTADTFAQMLPFVARLDTIDRGDTIGVAFTLADRDSGWFDLDVRHRPDSTITVNTHTREVVHERIIEPDRSHVALGIGAFGGVDLEPRFTYGVGLTLSYIIASW